MAGRLSMPSNDTQGEEWRDIPGFEGYYQASSLGRIRAITIRQQTEDPRYRRIRLRHPIEGWKTLAVHRLVCETFHGPPNERRADAAHFDGDMFNNQAANLRWASRKENMDDQFRHGTRVCGERHPQTPFTEANIREIRSLAESKTVSAIAKLYSVDAKSIRQILEGKTWRHVE